MLLLSQRLRGFSSMEFLLICSIVQHLMGDDWDWQQVQDITTEVSTMYCHILELVETLQLDLALFKRAPAKIEKLLCNTAFKWDVFRHKSTTI